MHVCLSGIEQCSGGSACDMCWTSLEADNPACPNSRNCEATHTVISTPAAQLTGGNDHLGGLVQPCAAVPQVRKLGVLGGGEVGGWVAGWWGKQEVVRVIAAQGTQHRKQRWAQPGGGIRCTRMPASAPGQRVAPPPPSHALERRQAPAQARASGRDATSCLVGTSRPLASHCSLL